MIPFIPEHTPSLEFLTTFDIFEKMQMIRRVSDINSKIVSSGSTLILPKNPMLHMLDNFGHSHQSTDTFDLAQYPFLLNKTNIKYLHHFTRFDLIEKSLLDTFSHRIFRTKLSENLKNFGISNRKFLITTPKLDTMLTNKNCIILINYNPLYRIIATSHRPIHQYYRYRTILTTALQQTKIYDRQHFLVISVPKGFMYDRSNIMSLVQASELSAQKLVSDQHFYFFFIDLIALLLNNDSPLSTFTTLEKRQLSLLNVMLIHEGQSIIFNIGKLATLIKTRSYVFNFADTIARLSGSNIPIQPLIDEPVEEQPVKQETPPVVQEQPQEPPVQKAPLHLQRNIVDSRKISLIPSIPNIDISDDIVDEVVIDDPLEEDTDDVIEEEIPTYTQKSTVLSERQMTRIEKLSTAYQSIVIQTPQGEKTIEEILNTPVQMQIQPQQLPVEHAEGIDPSMLTSTTQHFDEQYRTQLLQKDIISNLVVFKENGLFLTGYTERNEYTNFTRVKYIRASFQDIHGKKHTINFKLPIPDDEGCYLVNGVRLTMSKQLVNIPICKISPTRVSLISNYNKTLVDKVQSVRYSLASYLASKEEKHQYKLIPKKNTYIGIDLAIDYKQLGASYSKIRTPEIELFFEYPNRIDYVTNKLTESVDWTTLESKYGTLVGKALKEPYDHIFVSKNNACTVVNVKTNNIIQKDISLIELLGKIDVPAEWCDLKILDRNLPIVFILGYRFGLSAILRNMKIPHRFIEKAKRRELNKKQTEIVVAFSDGYLVFDRYPLRNSYILAGLLYFKTLDEVAMIDMDGKDAYYKLITDKGFSSNYLKGIDNHFDFFIDPITAEVLREMGEPTNTRDLLIRAVDMLINDPDKSPSAISNFRVRSAERLPAMIYNEISRQYANYINSNFKDVSFSINTEAIFQRIIQDETMNLKEDLNPVHALKETTRVTYTGFGGRSSEAFVARDRKYPDDAVGIISETTTDSGSVGMVAALSGDPNIINLRGMFAPTDEQATPTNKFSDIALLMPSALHDDPKRQNFTSIQLSHHIPTPNQEPMRFSTGYEMVIPQKTSGTFVGRAKQDGVVSKIDTSLKLIFVTYADGSTDVFEYGDIIGEGSGKAVNHKIDMHPDIHLNMKVKAGTVITYHSEFFHLDPITKQLAWCHGIPATVAIMPKDVTLEDSNMISAEFAEKMGFESIYVRAIQITNDMLIDAFADIGTKVSYNDPLLRLKYEETADVISDDIDELFLELKQVEYRSKHDGTVVGIQVFHVAESLNQSLTRFVNKVTYKDRRKSNVAKGTLKHEAMTSVTVIPEGTRIRGVQLGETDVLVVFFIKSQVACGIGDKCVVGNMLKTIIGRIEDLPMTTEEGVPVDMVFGANSIFDRIVLSCFCNSISDTILKKEEQRVLDMYFNEE